MKIPKTFIPENKDLKEKTEQLLREKYNPRTIELLLESCEEFLQKQEGKNYETKETKYQIGEELAKRIVYTKDDLELLSQKITIKKQAYVWLGVYFSALVNKVITEKDNITLTFDERLYGIGMYRKKGRITIEWRGNNSKWKHKSGHRIQHQWRGNNSNRKHRSGHRIQHEWRGK